MNADVPEPYEISLEWGIFGFTLEKQPGPDEVRIQSPGLLLNVGFPGDWQIILTTVHEFIDKENKGWFDSDINQFKATTGLIKNVWYRGRGWLPNFATQVGLLYPTERGTERARGADFAGMTIITWNLPCLSWHMTLGGTTKHTREEELPKETRANFVFGTILDVPVQVRSKGKIHLVGEYSGQKAEKEELKHQLLAGVVVPGPLGMAFDIAGFGGLSSPSVDWGITAGVTISSRKLTVGR